MGGGESLPDQKTGGYDSRYKYSGKETDENTGLNYHGARYYNPSISIWYGVDPLAEKYPGWSPYNYVLNNPVRLIDPTGMAPENGGEGCDPTFKMTNMSSNTKYGAVVVLPMNLDDHNGAIRADYNEAIKNNLPILQVADIKGFVDGMNSMAEQGISTNTYVISSHGRDGYFKIGSQKINNNREEENSGIPNLAGLKDGLKGKNVCIAACSVASGKSGQELIQLFSKATKSIVYASDHNTSGITDLNGHRFPYILNTGSGQIPFRYMSVGSNFNDYHMSFFGNKSRNVFDLKIGFSTGWIGTTATDFHR